MSALDTELPLVSEADAVLENTNGYAGERPLSHADLLAALRQVPDKAEIVQGRVIRFMPTGRGLGFAGDEIFFLLRSYVRQNQLSGIAVGDNKGFVVQLPNRGSFSPDAAYYVGPNSGAKFYEGAPRFAVEVRSEGDYGPAMEQELRDKWADYFAAGTTVVWDVDVLKGEDIIRKYTQDGGADVPVATFKRGDTADAEPAVPSFTVPVDALFE